MRIITGSARGALLCAPDGMHTRPTADKTKQAMFNILQGDLEGRTVLDLFGGSGQLGLEAASRGAASVTIVEQDRKAQQVIAKNLQVCRLEAVCRLVCSDAYGYLKRQKPGSVDLVFLDPPYGGALLNQALEEITRIDIMRPGGIIVCEYAAEDVLLPLSPPYFMGKTYRYGRICLAVVERGS